MKIAILSREKNKHSETFIRNQIRYLFEGNTHHLYGRGFPYYEGSSPIPGNTLTESFIEYFSQNGIQGVLANYATTGFDVMEACAELDLPLITHFHGWTAYRHHFVEDHMHLFPKLFDVSNRIIAVSPEMKNRLISLGAPKGKICHLVCGVSAELFQFRLECPNPSTAPLFLFVGRFTEKKQPGLVVRAFEHVQRTLQEARLVTIGDGHLLDATKERAAEPGIADKVTFRGTCSPQEVAAWMQRATALVQHSVTAEDGNREGTPNVILEAMLSGLPVVGTRHGGIKDVIDEETNGLLADEWDIDSMANHMLRVAESEQFAEYLAQNARQKAFVNYTLDHYMSSLENIVEEAARK